MAFAKPALPPGKRRPKCLALPGFRTSGAILKLQSAPVPETRARGSSPRLPRARDMTELLEMAYIDAHPVPPTPPSPRRTPTDVATQATG